MYDLQRDKELDVEFGKVDHNDDSGNDNEEHIPREKVRQIKKNIINKKVSTTVQGTFLKANHSKETNKEDKDDTMDTIYNKKEDEDKGMNPESET